MYIFRYKTQEKYSDLLMVSDGEYLTGLIFEGSKDMDKICSCCEERSLPVFEDTKKWLDIYFSGRDPGFVPRMKFTGISGFRAEDTLRYFFELWRYRPHHSGKARDN